MFGELRNKVNTELKESKHEALLGHYRKTDPAGGHKDGTAVLFVLLLLTSQPLHDTGIMFSVIFTESISISCLKAINVQLNHGNRPVFYLFIHPGSFREV